MHDELRPGVDRPQRRQYVILVLLITLLAIAGYFYRRGGTPLPGPGSEGTTSRVEDAEMPSRTRNSARANARYVPLISRHIRQRSTRRSRSPGEPTFFQMRTAPLSTSV